MRLTDGEHEKTMMYQVRTDEVCQARDILLKVYAALKQKGYNPINQIVGYLLSGDPAYITSHQSARNLVRKVERDELLEELVRKYVEEG
ncbi:MAG: IreB family regulatory phosphoprotein [bacterium]|nr:IreB family regulatory phosphoprotein [bacterium]